MKKLNYLPFAKLLLGLFLLFDSFASAASNSVTPEHSFVDAFKNFADTMFSLDYPFTSSGDMTQCLQREECGSLYFRAMTSLDSLFAIEHDQFFKNIIWAIDYYCLQDKDNWAENRCVVAIQMLYFFNSNQDDKKIMTFVSQAPAKLKNMMFSRYLVWLKSRPDTSKWQDYVDSEAQVYLENKQLVNAYLLKPGYEYNESIEIVKLQHDYWIVHRRQSQGTKK